MQFWAGVGLGFVANVVATKFWELWTRWQAHKAAEKFVGRWEAYLLKGRTVDTMPMKGAGLSVVSLRHGWWSVNSALLDVWSEDIGEHGEIRHHDGQIVLDDTIPWVATRIDRYVDSNEVAAQKLVIGPDFNIIYVLPDPTLSTFEGNYGKHAWRRQGVVPAGEAGD